MIYVEQRPGPPLALFIRTLWYTKGYQAPHRRERVLPNGAIQIVIDLVHDFIVDCGPTVDSEMQPSLIAGVHSEYMVIDTAGLAEMIGIEFWPGGFAPFFESPADEFTGRHVALDAVHGSAARTLRDRMREDSTPEAKFQIIEKTFLEWG